MNKKLLSISLAVGVLVLAGVVYFAGQNKNSKTSMMDSSENKEASMEDSSMKKSTLRDLMALGTNQKCTFTDLQSKSTGTVYVSGTKARSDVNIVFESQPSYMSHMISDGETIYVWQEGQKTGFKTSLTDINKVSEESEVPAQDKTVNVDDQVDYECNSWSVDPSLFTPPANVTFSDFGSMMEDAMEQSKSMMDSSENSDIKTQQCEACDSLPADAQAACKQSLGC